MIYVRRCGVRAALLATGLAGLLGTAAWAQDDFGGAKTLYVNASYEEALGVLDRQAGTVGTTGTRASELQHYRALCLIALGRTPEAEQAIALSVAADPFSIPDTSELSPRVASVFTTARGRLIPDVARANLAEGRQLMQKGDAAGASRRFEAVTKLLSEPGLAGRADLSDLTLAANAFAELTRAQIAAAAAAAAAAVPPPQAAPAPAPTPPPAAVSTPAPSPAAAPARASAAPATAQPAPQSGVTLRPPAAMRPGEDGIEASVAINQALPRWQPESQTAARLSFAGAVRVTIDTTGHVTQAVMDRSVYPPYDRLVLAAARNWLYRPAMRNGQPITSERVVEILLRPPTN
jgi:TonB family protein